MRPGCLVACLLLPACAAGGKAPGRGDETAGPVTDEPGDTAILGDSGPDTGDADPSADTSAETADDTGVSGDTGEGPRVGERRLALALATFDGHAAADRLGRGVAAVGDVNGDGCAGLLVGASTAAGTGRAYLVCTPPGGRVDVEAAATATFAGVDANSYLGASLAGGDDLDGDGLPDVAIGADGAGEGAVYVLAGPFAGEVSPDAAFLTVVGDGGESLSNVASVGDVTGDGAPDLALAGDGATGAPRYAGVVSVVSGGAGPSGRVEASDLDVRIVGSGYAEYAGDSLSRGGDLDGDGVDDLVVGGAGVGGSAHEGGVAWILPGPLAGTMSLADVAITVDGTGYGGGVSMHAAGVGDLDGDGYRDVGIGLPWPGAYAGSVFVVHGPPGDVVDVDDAATRFDGSWAGGQHGYAALPMEVGDLNADGTPDLAVGAPTTTGYLEDAEGDLVEQYDSAGALILAFGPFARGVHDLDDADTIWRGDQEYGHAGEPLAAPGDVDGDGCAEVLVGSWPYYDHQGHAWLVGGCAR